MIMTEILRYAIGLLASLTAGSVLVVALRYFRATWRNARQAPGRLLARHVAEVSAGTLLLVLGFAGAMYAQLYADDPNQGVTLRLWMYLVGMMLLLAGMFDLGAYQRRKRRCG